MNEAVHANEQLEMTFMINPKIPFSLIVNISTKETIKATVNEVSGPKIKPLIAIMMSLGSYFKKSTSCHNIGKSAEHTYCCNLFCPTFHKEPPKKINT